MPTTLQELLNDGVNTEDIYVLTKEGLAELTKEIFKNVNARIQERIVTDMDETSDDNHVPSALTVFDYVKKLSKIKNLTVASGNPEEAHITPDQETLYVVRKASTDNKAAMFVWNESAGYVLCGGELEDDEPEININAIPNETIQEIVSTSYTETDPGIDGDEPDSTT